MRKHICSAFRSKSVHYIFVLPRLSHLYTLHIARAGQMELSKLHAAHIALPSTWIATANREVAHADLCGSLHSGEVK